MRLLYLDKPLIDLIVYKPVEYLEATGTQYINTGLLSTGQSKVDITYSFSTMASGVANNCAIFGGRSSTTYTVNTFTMFKLAGASPQNFRFDYNGQKNIANASSLTWNTTSKYRMTYDGSRASVTNITTGETDGMNISPAESFTTTPIAIFAVNTLGNAQQFMNGRIYHYWYTDGTNTIDLYPVVRRSDNVAGMYDLVSGTLFTNNGTGTFNVGDEVLGPTSKKMHLIKETKRRVPTGFTEVEYLQSSGTQYIDTGWTPKSSDLRVKFKVKSMGSPNTKAICGAEKTGTTPRWVFILYGQNANVNKTFPLTGDWNNNSNGFTFTSGTVLDIDWTASSTSTTITDKVSNTTYTQAMGSAITYSNNDVTLKLFQNSNSQKSSIQMNYYQIYDGGVLVRNFIPCLDASNVPCMYDTVEQKAYYNAGTGSFTYGATIIPVEYLESTGTQYIDTQVFPVMDKIKLEILAIKETGFSLFGSYESGKNFNFTGTSGKNYLRYGSSYTTAYTVVDGDKPHTFIADKGTIYVDGVQQGATVETITGTSINSIALYGRLSGSTNTQITDKGSHTIYYCKIWNNGSMVRDYIPVKDSNGVGYMFDKVSHTLYANAGSGSFVVGNEPKDITRFVVDSVPNGYQRVKYIQSSGTQFIDLGTTIVTSTDEIEMYFQMTETNNYKWLFGEYDTNNRLGLGSGDGTNKRNFLYGSTVTKMNDTEVYDVPHKYTVNSNGGFMDDVKKADYQSISSTSTLYLFNLNIDSTSDYRCRGKIWSYRQKRNGVLIRNLVPVIRKSDNEIGFYDLISKQFFGNIGTGSFTYG